LQSEVDGVRKGWPLPSPPFFPVWHGTDYEMTEIVLSSFLASSSCSFLFFFFFFVLPERAYFYIEYEMTRPAESLFPPFFFSPFLSFCPRPAFEGGKRESEIEVVGFGKYGLDGFPVLFPLFSPFFFLPLLEEGSRTGLK